jgi:hypothetical protein
MQDAERKRLEDLQREIAVGIEQLDTGRFTEYDDDTLPHLARRIKERGRRLASDSRFRSEPTSG